MASSVLRPRQAMAWVVAACAGALAVSCANPSATGAGPTSIVTQPGSSSAGSPSPAATSGPSACATSALRMTLGPWEGAAAGHLYRSLDFTNITGASCTLYGYPGASFVTAIGGKQVGAAAGRSPARKRLIVLAPGQKAQARLDLVDVLNFPSSVCGAVNAHWLKVYPPNQFSALYVRWTAKVCSKPKPVYLFADPVRPSP